VHVQHEVGRRHLHAVELVQRVVVELERLATDDNLQEPVAHAELRQQHRMAQHQIEEDVGLELFDRPGLAPDRRRYEDAESEQQDGSGERADPKRAAHRFPPSGEPT